MKFVAGGDSHLEFHYTEKSLFTCITYAMLTNQLCEYRLCKVVWPFSPFSPSKHLHRMMAEERFMVSVMKSVIRIQVQAVLNQFLQHIFVHLY